MPNIDSHGSWALHGTPHLIKYISEFVVQFGKDKQRIPTESEGLAALSNDYADAAYRPDPLSDIWSHPFIYKVLDQKTQKFVIYSAGPDGIDDNQLGDDVVAGPKKYQCKFYGSCLNATDYVNYGFAFATIASILAWLGLTIYWVFKRIKRNRI